MIVNFIATISLKISLLTVTRLTAWAIARMRALTVAVGAVLLQQHPSSKFIIIAHDGRQLPRLFTLFTLSDHKFTIRI
jgi:hypothetical protein